MVFIARVYYTVIIGKELHEVRGHLVPNLIKAARDVAVERRAKYALLAVRKGDHVELKKNTYVNPKSLYKNIDKYMLHGFTCYYYDSTKGHDVLAGVLDE